MSPSDKELLAMAIVHTLRVRIALRRERRASRAHERTIDGVPKSIVRGRDGRDHVSIEIDERVSRVVALDEIASVVGLP